MSSPQAVLCSSKATEIFRYCMNFRDSLSALKDWILTEGRRSLPQLLLLIPLKQLIGSDHRDDHRSLVDDLKSLPFNLSCPVVSCPTVVCPEIACPKVELVCHCDPCLANQTSLYDDQDLRHLILVVSGGSSLATLILVLIGFAVVSCIRQCIGNCRLTGKDDYEEELAITVIARHD